MANNKFEEKSNFEKEKEIKKTTEKAPIETKEKIVVEENKVEMPVSEVVEIDKDFILKILLDANRDLKINDMIIYNKLDLYQYEPDKRKFYQLLIGTDMFACNKDAIIIVGNKAQVDNINSQEINKELYAFINLEFGIDKMVYAITEDEKNELIERYKKEPVESRNKPVFVEKYTIKKAQTSCPEDTLNMLFGDIVKVEE